MKIHKGEIYLANFEFPHTKENKIRPVIILQCDADNQNPYYPFVIIAPITTKKVDKIYKQDVFLPKETSNLDKDSKIIVGALTILTKSSLTKYIGRVDITTTQQINLKLIRLLDL